MQITISLDAFRDQNAWFPRFPLQRQCCRCEKKPGADVRPERNRKRSQDSIPGCEDKDTHQAAVKIAASPKGKSPGRAKSSNQGLSGTICTYRELRAIRKTDR
jgi:hypothetical protein